MVDSIWLLLTGLMVGLLVRKIAEGHAYGAVTDMLLGISGAFGTKWLIEQIGDWTSAPGSDKLLFVIWGSAALPALAHLYTKRHQSPKPHHLRRHEPPSRT